MIADSEFAVQVEKTFALIERYLPHTANIKETVELCTMMGLDDFVIHNLLTEGKSGIYTGSIIDPATFRSDY